MQTRSLAGRDFIAVSDFTEEETATILDAPDSVVCDRAENRMHGRMAVMVLTVRGLA